MFERVKSDMLGSVFVFGLLLAFWLLISGEADWQHMLTGSIFSLILTVFWSNLTISHEHKTEFTLRQIYMLIKYFFLLGKEIVLANIQVAIIVLNPRLPISPGMVIRRCELERNLIRVLYVNSITLCPGTITVELEDNLLIVHAFTREYADELKESEQYKRLLEMESEYKK